MSNVTIADAPELEHEEETEKLDKLVKDPIKLSKNKSSEILTLFWLRITIPPCHPRESWTQVHGRQENCKYHLTYSNQNVLKNKNSWKHLQKCPRPDRSDEIRKSSWGSFHTVFIKNIIKNIVHYTNAVIQPTIDFFLIVLKKILNSAKNTIEALSHLMINQQVLIAGRLTSLSVSESFSGQLVRKT